MDSLNIKIDLPAMANDKHPNFVPHVIPLGYLYKGSRPMKFVNTLDNVRCAVTENNNWF